MSNNLDLSLNSRRIIASIRTEGPQSRADLARHLGVNPATITRLTSTLVDEEILREAPDKRREGLKGYPAKLLSINPTALYSAGIYLDPDKIRTCLIDASGEVQVSNETSVTDHSFSWLMSKSRESLQNQIDELAIKRSRLAGCGFCYPGQYGEDLSHVRRIQQFEGWPNINVKKDLEPYFEMSVSHMNDAKAACLAELHHGACSDVENFCYIWLSYGIGGGAVLAGNLNLGRLKGAAEWGGLFPKSAPRPSGQDLFDTLRTSGVNIERLNDINDQHLELPVAKAWKQRAADQLKWLCLVIARTYDPQTIVIGGTLPVSLLGYFVGRLNEPGELGEDYFLPKPNIVRAERDQLPELGAAAIPIHQLTNPTAYAGKVGKGW